MLKVNFEKNFYLVMVKSSSIKIERDFCQKE